ncbi:hypothetical protein GCM10010172_04930 [Paractinoplanes ferrugineus]|uniref:Lipoprotein n=1 Tax=Paractinoplanes ferrugineus TaxID=113564 RepID=A0A919J253_9ACTN|nr:hypothetical protein [Actinoplanes ferrugineus]GIE12590.1 hypothetical protein Afe05nite_44300 [Actinoplanes ferrugineus]
MRRFAPILAVSALVCLSAACDNGTTERVGGAAAPVGGGSSAPAPASEPASGLPPVGGTVSPTPRASSSAPVDAPTSRPARTDTADLTIEPDHIGPLKIGMSLTAARKTGLIVVSAADSAGDTCSYAHWKGQSKDAGMVFNGRYGLRALSSFGNQKTPAGIHPGSTLAAVRAAYPGLTWRIDGDEIPDAKRTDGDVMVDVVKGDGAHYRINVQKSKVTDIDLESDRTGCYE